MRKSLLSCALLFFLSSVDAQNYYMAAPEGFGENATGGGTAAPQLATTYNDLKAKISASGAAVILVSGTITIPAGGSISAVVSDKTIVGLPGARLVNNTQTQSGSGILYLKQGSSNVIIRNLVFEGPGAYDVDGRDNLTADGCTDLWVDHCEFQDGIDGNFDIKGKSDNVSVTWCKFTYLKPPLAGGSGGANDHRYSNLVGSGSSDAPVDGHYSVTFQNCYWADGCRERMPRARNAELHILNCYYNTSVPGSRALGLGGGINNLSCYVENTDFDTIGTTYKDYSSSDGGAVALAFDGCLNGVADVGTVAKPNYSYTVLPVADVSTYIANPQCGAGATLDVTAEGNISSPCGSSTGFADPAKAGIIKLYPAVTGGSLIIDFSDACAGKASIDIYSIDGQLMSSISKDIPGGRKIQLNVAGLPGGLYLCRIQNGQTSATHRLIKS
ncbi:MAG: T9SS type A sorting domain-containing protein [Saprospiraceae bacterium]